MKLTPIFESILDESSRKTINDIKGLMLIHKDNIFLLYDPINKIPLGYISFGLTDGGVYSIYGAYAEEGYGPVLYESVMTYVYPKGVTMSDESGTSGDALAVWDKFNSRTDVKKEPINRAKKSEKEIDLIDGCDGNEDCLDWVRQILSLHYTKFIYSFGKPILNDMIQKGNQYLELNPSLDIQSMVYGLES